MVTAEANDSGEVEGDGQAKTKKKRGSRAGHGRYGFEDYPDARVQDIKVGDKVVGDRCPSCDRGKLYKSEGRKLLQFRGNQPVSVERYRKEVLRCNCCGMEFMSHQAINKWDKTARSAIVLQRTSGMPFNRLSGLQGLHGTPVAASTLWMQCRDLWTDCAAAVYYHLVELAKGCKTFVIDDTGAKILEVIAENKGLPVKEQRSCHTTGICTETLEKNKIILYITSNNYCGENIAPLVKERENKHHYIKLISDASSQNKPKVEEEELKQVIIANCLSHGRQKFYELKDNYPKECGYFLQEIKSIYEIEEKSRNLCPRKRLRLHKEHSSKHIASIYGKIRELYKEKLVEPNSDLGRAMNYWLRHKKELTKFLRVKGIELDTNKVERALKSIILQRKNSLFFKSKDSAGVLSGFHSIVKTCQENGVNAYGYLNWIQDNYQKVQKKASGYMPWNYLSYINDTELIAA